MTIPNPPPTAGLRHVALFIHYFEACIDFYTRLLGMRIEWQPDDDNIYLTSGNDNLALHRMQTPPPQRETRMDHMGFILNTPEDVDQWFDFLKDQGVTMKTIVRTHRDGAKSFYCEDPDGNQIQMIFHPPISTLPKGE